MTDTGKVRKVKEILKRTEAKITTIERRVANGGLNRSTGSRHVLKARSNALNEIGAAVSPPPKKNKAGGRRGPTTPTRRPARPKPNQRSSRR